MSGTCPNTGPQTQPSGWPVVIAFAGAAGTGHATRGDKGGCAIMLCARYSCSASNTLTSACGSVNADNASNCCAACLTEACRPSAAPMMNATSPPSRIHSCICAASCPVVGWSPCSSSAMRRQFCGSAARMRRASASMICAVVLPVVRGSGLISCSTICASRGMRFAYSLKPAVIQSGILWPTDKMISFTSLKTPIQATEATKYTEELQTDYSLRTL